jgi:8-amino-7-oxononanoate synthase
LSGHADVAAAAKAAIDRYGTSASASRIASGEIPLHRQLEAALAELVGADDAVTFNSGYGTNVGLLGHLFGRDDIILHDKLIHSSALVGAQLSGGRRLPFRHNDLDHLEQLLAENRRQHRRALILVEGVYSMDGDVPDLPRLIELKRKYSALLMIDEAHSLGVLGATGHGIGEHYGINPKDVDLWMGTLSKSLASCGGYIAGDHELLEYIKYTAPAFVYSVGMTPPDTAAALAAIQVMRREPERVTKVRANATRFLSLAQRHGLDTGPSGGSAIVPIIIGDSVLSLRLSEALGRSGINVQPIFYPAVEESSARLRFFISTDHSVAQLESTASCLAAALDHLATAPRVASTVFGGS